MRFAPIILLSYIIFSLLAISGESEQPGNFTPIYLGRILRARTCADRRLNLRFCRAAGCQMVSHVAL
jgi:hypothetical protein